MEQVEVGIAGLAIAREISAKVNLPIVLLK